MPILARGRRRIRYELDSPAEGPPDGPAFVLVNGLTQYIELWEPYRYMLVAKGFRVATFDLLGQGVSDKPSLHITQDDQVAVLYDIISELGEGRSSLPVSASAGSLRSATRSLIRIRSLGWCPSRASLSCRHSCTCLAA